MKINALSILKTVGVLCVLSSIILLILRLAIGVEIKTNALLIVLVMTTVVVSLGLSINNKGEK